MEEAEKVAYIIELKPNDFWQLTPSELDALYTAWETRKELEDRRIARICATLANVNRNAKKRKNPYTEDDFMPKAKQTQTPEQMLEIVKALNNAYGGSGG